MASVPGVHRGPESDKWGHRRLGHLLKKHATIPSLLSPSESNESWPVIAQCSSIGTLGAGPDAWMCGELRASMSQRSLLPGDMLQPPPKFKVVSRFDDISLLGCVSLSLIIIIIINCNWVVTRWQWLFYMYTKYEIGY